VPQLTVDELARLASEEILRAGGHLTEDSSGRTIWPQRVDVRLPLTVYDPQLGRAVPVRVRLRVTVELDAAFMPTQPNKAV